MNITETDMAVVKIQRSARATGYTLNVSRSGHPYTAKVINPQGCNIICQSSSDDRLIAAQSAWDKFTTIADDLGIEL